MAAAITSTTLITHFNVDVVIFCGVTGAAHPDLAVGDIVIGDRTIQHDMNTEPLFPKFQIPLTDITYFAADKKLVALASEAASTVIATKEKLDDLPITEFNPNPLNVMTGTLASGDQFIADKNKVKALSAEIENLYAVDMESAAVAQVCSDYQRPFVAIRVISDKADGSAHIDFPKFIAELASPLDALIVEQLLELLSATLNEVS